MKIVFLKACLKALRKMPVDDIVQIALKLGRYAENADANLDVKPLRGEERVYRLRHGDYRALFEINDDEMRVVKIGHRKDIYEN